MRSRALSLRRLCTFTSFIHCERSGAKHPSQGSLAQADRDPRLTSERRREEYCSIRELNWTRNRSKCVHAVLPNVAQIGKQAAKCANHLYLVQAPNHVHIREHAQFSRRLPPPDESPVVHGVAAAGRPYPIVLLIRSAAPAARSRAPPAGPRAPRSPLSCAPTLEARPDCYLSGLPQLPPPA